MSFKPMTAIRNGFVAFWHALDATRRAIFNIILLIIIIMIVVSMATGGVKPLEEKTALVLDLKGDLVEQHEGDFSESLQAAMGGETRHSVQLRDLITVIDAAAKDKKITSVVLMLDELGNAGQAMLHDVGASLDRVRKAGKPIVAWGGSYSQRQYLMASHASEIYVHPMGMVYIEGFGRHRTYYRDALDKLGVTVNLLRVGTFKSFGEPYIANGPSPEAAEADSFLYNALWSNYVSSVEKNRKLPAGAIMANINALPELVKEAKGDMAQIALKAKFVDGLKTRDEVRAMMIKRGAPDDKGKTFRQVSFHDYLARQKPLLFGDGIGVVVAAGGITDGTAGPGSIGGLSTANLIRKAREDDDIKAIVLRVDSPGGSAYGSELIRRELQLTRDAGKPVVVSMGNVAASGGYWISMAADEVIADESTITGSIGVFAMLPTAEKTVEKLGIHTAGVTTTWLADAYNPMRALEPRFAALVQGSIDHIYSEFTTKAAAARKTTVEKIDSVAQGRVWTGAQAKERGLIDRVGSYQDALDSAAKRAKLGDDYRVSYIEREGNAFERLITAMGGSAAQAIRMEVKLGLLPSTGLPSGAVSEVSKDFRFLSELTEGRKPFAAVTHCMCVSP
ncbi:MAG: signal peptide peptidase SppA [Pseudomonadota bacterium]